MEFAGKTAVITGAASGIGEGLAREAVARGMKLVIADRDAAGLDRVAQSLNTDVLAVPTDVSNGAAVEALAEATYARFGAADLLFNNAGVMATGFIWEIETARWDTSLGVNINGVLNGIRSFVPRMIAAGGGHVVNTASVGGFNASPLMAPYSASKFAVVAITEALYGELKLLNSPVGVSLLAPGPVRSAIFANPFGKDPHPATQQFVKGITDMIDRYGLDPDEFAKPTFDAIAAGEYWIVPQPEALDPMVETRTRMILDRRPPAGG